MASKTMMKKTKLEEYTQQKQQAAELAAQASKRIAQADENYQAIKAEYESFVKASLISGADNSDAIDKLAARVDDAEKIARRRREESSMASSNDVITVTPDQLIEEFRTTVGPAFKAAQVTPALEAVRAAKVAYAAAVFAYKDVESEFDNVAGEYIDQLGDSYRYKFGGVLPANRSDIDYFFMRPADAEKIQSGLVPESIKSEVQR